MAMVDFESLKLRMSSMADKGLIVNFDAAKRTFDSLDLASIEAKHRVRVKAEVWHGEPINGVDVLSHPNPVARKHIQDLLVAKKGSAYKISIDGKVVVFQYHNPSIAGFEPIDKAECMFLAQEHANKIVNFLMEAEVLQNMFRVSISHFG